MISLSHITKVFEHEKTRVSALDNVSFDLNFGDSLAICGSSGAGKSTLLNIMGGLDKPTSGHVKIEDKLITDFTPKQEANFRNEKLGFVFQFHHLLADFSILENVMMPLLIAKNSFALAKDQAVQILERVGLKDMMNRFPMELSGGEQQRAAIARAIVHKPRYIFADEPTGNLDDKNGQLVFELLCELNHDLKSTLIMVTHHQAFANKLDKKLVLDKGKMI